MKSLALPCPGIVPKSSFAQLTGRRALRSPLSGIPAQRASEGFPFCHKDLLRQPSPALSGW